MSLDAWGQSAAEQARERRDAMRAEQERKEALKPPPPAPRVRYEYMHLGYNPLEGDEVMLQKLNALGAKGWVVVVKESGAFKFLLMREVPGSAQP